MTAGARVAAFAALLAAIFALATLAGRAAGPVSEPGSASGHRAGMGASAPHEAAPAAAGLRLAATGTALTAGRAQRLRFTIHDAHGRTVRDFAVEQGRRMHLIVVRRDLRLFQHLHPAQAGDGSWSARLTLPAAGVYHAFADFETGGARHALGTDLFVAGRFEPLALPAPRPTARADGYEVALREGAGPGELRFSVSRDGARVDDLQPYLGAKGHLVMLRAGDLAYEHVHPLTTRALAFDAAGAGPGRYRLFLQFRHADRVHTAAFTREVAR
jgi:hypothetical protein